jgi:hypothetical protein
MFPIPKTYFPEKVSFPFRLGGALETRLGSRPHIVAKAETTGYMRAFRRACDWQPRGRLGSAVGYRALQRCAQGTRFR